MCVCRRKLEKITKPGNIPHTHTRRLSLIKLFRRVFHLPIFPQVHAKSSPEKGSSCLSLCKLTREFIFRPRFFFVHRRNFPEKKIFPSLETHRGKVKKNPVCLSNTLCSSKLVIVGGGQSLFFFCSGCGYLVWRYSSLQICERGGGGHAN